MVGGLEDWELVEADYQGPGTVLSGTLRLRVGLLIHLLPYLSWERNWSLQRRTASSASQGVHSRVLGQDLFAL